MRQIELFNHLLFTPLRLFHTSVSEWFPTGFLVTASPLQFPRLFSVFWPSLIILCCGWSPLVLSFPSLPISLSILWGLSQVLQLQLVSPLPSCYIVFPFSCKVQVLILLFAFLHFHSVIYRDGKVPYSASSLFFLFVFFFFCFFFLLSQGLVVWPR